MYNERLEELIENLKGVDWNYEYSSGSSYYDGRESVYRARGYIRAMIADYPEREKEINEIVRQARSGELWR